MIELQGKYNKAKVFTDIIETEAMSQIINLLNQPFSKDAQIRIMPDVHAGKGCTIGFSANLVDIAIPNLVGVDIGCGVLVANIGDIDIDFEKLDNFIRNNIPHGFGINQEEANFPLLNQLRMYKQLNNVSRIKQSLGSLGGGNHFIEIAKGDNNKYLLIHSGSRNLGKQVCEYYQNLAVETCTESVKGLEYLTGQNRLDYLHDMQITQQYATQNRVMMAIKILDFLGIPDYDIFQSIHNYIDENNMIRKGAISAKKDELMVIPLNMKDGSLICKGLGNKDWNETAPHGAGRIMSRSKAKKEISLEDFQEIMEGIYSTSVSKNTIDEAPFAYKDKQIIIDAIGETAEIIEHIEPIYNFKA